MSDLYALNEGDKAGHLVPRWFQLWDKEMEGMEISLGALSNTA